MTTKEFQDKLSKLNADLDKLAKAHQALLDEVKGGDHVAGFRKFKENHFRLQEMNKRTNRVTVTKELPSKIPDDMFEQKPTPNPVAGIKNEPIGDYFSLSDPKKQEIINEPLTGEEGSEPEKVGAPEGIGTGTAEGSEPEKVGAPEGKKGKKNA